MYFALAANLDFEPFGDGVDTLRTDTVETTGDLISAFAELAAGVEISHHELKSRDVVFRVDVDRNASAIVLDGA